jgi:hypothetical protein
LMPKLDLTSHADLTCPFPIGPARMKRISAEDFG